jgi:hypothetical protein
MERKIMKKYKKIIVTVMLTFGLIATIGTFQIPQVHAIQFHSETENTESQDLTFSNYSDMENFVYEQSHEEKPIVVEYDVDTDMITEVEYGSPILALISSANSCSAGSSCFYSGAVPYANVGFSGVGTKTGTWYERSAFSSGNHKSIVKYLNSAKTANTKTLPVGTTITFSKNVTGTSVQNLT